jgi:hypothetical protein
MIEDEVWARGSRLVRRESAAASEANGRTGCAGTTCG